MPQRFNERGFFKSAGYTVDENDVISEYDGNLSMVYNTKIYVPNNMGGDLTLIFNQNVEHRTFIIPTLFN
jgi:hypothetical protein